MGLNSDVYFLSDSVKVHAKFSEKAINIDQGKGFATCGLKGHFVDRVTDHCDVLDVFTCIIQGPVQETCNVLYMNKRVRVPTTRIGINILIALY